MGQTHVSHTMCCSIRDKYDPYSGTFPSPMQPQFLCSQVFLELDSPRFLAFGPLWQRDNAPPRRLAIATQTQVHVYLMKDSEPCQTGAASSVTPGGDSGLILRLEHSLTLDADMEITAMIFSDDSSSRTIVVAAGPTASKAKQVEKDISQSPMSRLRQPTGNRYQVRFFQCDGQGQLSSDFWDRAAPPPKAWRWNEDMNFELEAQDSPVEHLATSQTILVAATTSGVCGTWQKSRGFGKRHTVTQLHQGSIADIAVDRYFVYTCGRDDLKICIWSVPDLTCIIATTAEIPEDLFFALQPPPGAVSVAPIVDADTAPTESLLVEETSEKASSSTSRLSSLTALRRPLSRWAGSQGSSRSAKAPKGTLFVAGVLAENCEVASRGAGVLMEFSLQASSEEGAICQSAQIAHESPIATIAYGPYDNGPVITADVHGIFRIWDCVPRLTCSQHPIEIVAIPGSKPQLSVVVEPQKGFFSCNGDSRLFVWRRSLSQDIYMYGGASQSQ